MSYGQPVTVARSHMHGGPDYGVTLHKADLSCWNSGFSWEFCCDHRLSIRSYRTGNWLCWSGNSIDFDRCCVFWIGSRNEDELPRYHEPLLWFGLRDDTELAVTQMTAAREVAPGAIGGTETVDGPLWVGSFLWRPGATLARWLDWCVEENFLFGKSVLEVAAGVALPSAIAFYHCANVTVTDASQLSFWASHRNLAAAGRHRIAGGRYSCKPSVRFHNFDLFGTIQEFEASAVGKFDVVMGAGFYGVQETRFESRANLSGRLASLLARCRSAVLILVSLAREIDAFLTSDDSLQLRLLSRAHVYSEPDTGEPSHLAVFERADESTCKTARDAPPSARCEIG